MASSRLEKIGTIFTRTTGLLKSNAMKIEDKPLWYDICTTFPPKYEPRYDRPATNVEVKPIFYKEDTIRAKFYKTFKNTGAVNLIEGKHQNRSQSQTFIAIYNKLEQQGALSEEKIFETSQDLLQTELETQRSTANKNNIINQPGLVSSFSDAQNQKVNIKDIFKSE